MNQKMKRPAPVAAGNGAKADNLQQGAAYHTNKRPAKDRHTVHVTVFNNKAARTMRTCEVTLPQLADMVRHATAPTKTKLPWIKLARFGDLRTDAGSLRHNANVLSIAGVELDYDQEEISFPDALATLHRLQCRALLYTSPSHTLAAPRWRILLPTSKELDPGLRHELAQAVDDHYGGGVFDPGSFTLSRAFYFGEALDNPNRDHLVATVDGGFIDLCAAQKLAPASVAAGLRKGPAANVARAPPDPAIAAMLEQYAGAGVSTDPDDYWAEDADPKLKIMAALAYIPSDDYWVWLHCGAAIYNTLGDDGFELFVEWSRGSSKYNDYECQKKWRECAKFYAITAATIYRYADQHDRGWRTLYQLLSEVVA